MPEPAPATPLPGPPPAEVHVDEPVASVPAEQHPTLTVSGSEARG